MDPDVDKRNNGPTLRICNLFKDYNMHQLELRIIAGENDNLIITFYCLTYIFVWLQ